MLSRCWRQFAQVARDETDMDDVNGRIIECGARNHPSGANFGLVEAGKW